jgi:hypothetical protein
MKLIRSSGRDFSVARQAAPVQAAADCAVALKAASNPRTRAVQQMSARTTMTPSK